MYKTITGAEVSPSALERSLSQWQHVSHLENGIIRKDSLIKPGNATLKQKQNKTSLACQLKKRKQSHQATKRSVQSTILITLAVATHSV